jgi:hypothetical protein
MSLFNALAVDKMSPAMLQTKIPQLVTRIQTSYYNLGGLIQRVRDEGLFVNWAGYEYASFEAWCDDILKFRMRKAQHLITIYKTLREMAPKQKTMDRLVALGWVKVGQILRVAETKKQMLKWLKVAEGLSLRELQGKVSFAVSKKDSTGDDVLDVVDEKTVSRKFAFNKNQSEHLDKVLDLMHQRYPTSTDGELLDMMAVNYMATHVRDDEGGLAVELNNILVQIEAAYGVKLKVTKSGAKKASPGKKKAKKKAKSA